MPDSSPIGFPSTMWTQVHQAGAPGGDAVLRRGALNGLIERYWKPVYWYLRLSQNRDDAAARDLAQAFFLHLLETDVVAKADPDRGRFRNFLKTSLKNYVVDAGRIENALRRGGDTLKIPLEDVDAGGGSLAAGRELGPEQMFEREWRAALVHNAIEAVRRRFIGTDREIYFEVFRAFNVEGAEQISYTGLAERFHISEDDVRNYLRVARREFKDAVVAEIRETVGSGEELESELNELFRDLR